MFMIELPRYISELPGDGIQQFTTKKIINVCGKKNEMIYLMFDHDLR